MAVIEKRKGANGTPVYRVKIRLKGHRPKSSTFERLSDAKDWAQKEEADIKRGLKFDDYNARTHTLSKAIEEYLNAPDLNMKPAQLAQRKMQLDWWKERIGAHFLSDITPDKLNVFKRELMRKRKSDEKNAPFIKPATINHYLIALSSVFAYARKELNWIRYNPVKDISKVELNNSRVRFLTNKERESLLVACQNKTRHKLLYPLVLIAISTGMRKGEITALRWRDINFNKRILIVENSKNGDKRSVPLTGMASEVLFEMNKVRRIDTELVFARKDGLAPMELKKHWEGAVKASKLQDFRFHDLRHTAATYLLESGATLPELSSILGHRTIQMVKRYAHLADNHAVEVVERMTRRMFE